MQILRPLPQDSLDDYPKYFLGLQNASTVLNSLVIPSLLMSEIQRVVNIKSHNFYEEFIKGIHEFS